MVVLAVIVGLVYIQHIIPSSSPVPAEPQTTIAPDPRKEYVDSISEQSVATNVIDISECTAAPQVSTFPLGTTVTFANRDARPHTVSFDPATTFVVPAHGTSTTTLSAWKSPGVRHFSCDSSLRIGTVYFTLK